MPRPVVVVLGLLTSTTVLANSRYSDPFHLIQPYLGDGAYLVKRALVERQGIKQELRRKRNQRQMGLSKRHFEAALSRNGRLMAGLYWALLAEAGTAASKASGRAAVAARLRKRLIQDEGYDVAIELDLSLPQFGPRHRRPQQLDIQDRLNRFFRHAFTFSRMGLGSPKFLRWQLKGFAATDLFNMRAVAAAFTDPREIEARVRDYLGGLAPSSPQDYAALVGAPDGSHVEIEPVKFDGGDEALEIAVWHPFIRSAYRSLLVLKEAGPELLHHYLVLHQDAPPGLASEMLTRALVATSTLLPQVEHVVGDWLGGPFDAFNGYDLAGRLGYNGTPPKRIRNAVAAIVPPEIGRQLPKKWKLNDLMLADAILGPEIWRWYGRNLPELTVFSTAPDSSSHRVLEAYRQRMGIEISTGPWKEWDVDLQSKRQALLANRK